MPDDLDDVVVKYRATLLEMHDGRIESGGRPDRWNRLVNRLQSLQLQLARTPEGRAAITQLLAGENLTVREWSATHALAWDPAAATAALEQIATADAGLAGFEAKVTLREYRAGRLRTDWQPKEG